MGAYLCDRYDCKCKTCKRNNSDLRSVTKDCYACRDCYGGNKKKDNCIKYSRSI